jgi:cation:H+ antiporter
VLVLEGALVIAVLTVAVMGSQLPPSLMVWRVEPEALLIAMLWVVGLLLLNRARSDLPWQEKGEGPGGQEKSRGHSRAKKEREARSKGVSTARAAAVFSVAALVTLVGGVVLEKSGDAIAGKIGMSGVLFAATFLAAATSLPEVSTGLTSVRMGDYKLAVSDIFGGNAFLPVLFLMAGLLSVEAVLPRAHDTDIYLTGLGILLTVVYLFGLIFRPRRRVLGMGMDSLVVLILYAVGVAGLVAVALGGG